MADFEVILPTTTEEWQRDMIIAYNQALEDFVEFANTMPTVEMEDGEIRPLWLEEIAERLKR